MSQGSVIYTLIFAEREVAGRAEAAINGPFLCRSMKSAQLKFYEYVRGRILASDLSEMLVEDADSLGLNLFAHTADDDEPMLKDEVKAMLCAVNFEQVEAICEWYVNFVDDENTECFYTIAQVNTADILG